MTDRVAFPAAFLVVGCAMLSACNTTGGTSRFVLSLDLDQPPNSSAEIRVASAGRDVNPAYLTAWKVFRWGKCDVADMRSA